MMAKRFATACVVLVGVTGCAADDDGGSGLAPPETSPATVTTTPPDTSPPPATTAAPTRPPPTAVAPAAVVTEPPGTAAPATAAPITAPPPFTVEELNGTLGQAATDWAAAPSGATYDSLAAGAAGVLATGRPLPPGVGDLLDRLTTYPGSDVLVLAIFDQLGPALPTVDRAAFVTTTLPPVQRPVAVSTDPRFGTCGDAKAAGYGPYSRGDPEYGWYRDADGDGSVCE